MILRPREVVPWRCGPERPDNPPPGAEPDPGVQQAGATSIEKHLAALGGFPPGLAKPRGKLLHDIRQHIATFTYGTYTHLKNWLNQELAQENASGIRRMTTATQELTASSAKLEETLRQLSMPPNREKGQRAVPLRAVA